MKNDNLTFAGTILKAHGFEGAVVVKAEAWLQEIIKTDGRRICLNFIPGRLI